MTELTPETTPDAAEIDAAVVAVSDGAYTLIVADFDDTDAAWAAYELLKSVEDGRTVEIESVVVVKRGEDGTLEIQKATDHSTGRGLGWGIVGRRRARRDLPAVDHRQRHRRWAPVAPPPASSASSTTAASSPTSSRTRSSPGTRASSPSSPIPASSRSARPSTRPTASWSPPSTTSSPRTSRQPPRRPRRRPRPRTRPTRPDLAHPALRRPSLPRGGRLAVALPIASRQRVDGLTRQPSPQAGRTPARSRRDPGSSREVRTATPRGRS